MNIIKKLALVAAAAPVAFVATTAMNASAWPKPEVSVSCTEIRVKEVAPDSDWVKTAYWTIDGIPGQFARGHTEIISDTTATSRVFIVRWFDQNGNQLDWVPSDPAVRNLEICQVPVKTEPAPDTTVPVTTAVPATQPTVPVVTVISGPADPIPTTTVPVVAVDNPPTASLPATGSDVEPWVWAAACLAFAGAIMMIASRRRNAAEHKVITTVG